MMPIWSSMFGVYIMGIRPAGQVVGMFFSLTCVGEQMNSSRNVYLSILLGLLGMFALRSSLQLCAGLFPMALSQLLALPIQGTP